MTGELALEVQCDNIQKPSQWTELTVHLSDAWSLRMGFSSVVCAWLCADDLRSLTQAGTNRASIQLPTQRVLFWMAWLL